MNTLDRDEYIKQLKKFEKIRTDFVANVSHELRTPLTVFHGYLESLIDEAQDHQWQPIFLQMQQQCSRMEKLVSDLLLLARLESEQNTTENKTIFDVAVMLDKIIVEAQALNPTHEIISDIDRELTFNGFEHELQSAFSNLIFNAVYYTSDHGTITLKWYREGENAIFSVADTGIGIEQKHIARLTERFYRVDKARSRGNGGTGLGLAIIKHVLLHHNAELKIDSELGKGSVFTCIMPQE